MIVYASYSPESTIEKVMSFKIKRIKTWFVLREIIYDLMKKTAAAASIRYEKCTIAVTVQ
ncbi:MAG: hypothetical protein GPOALKHO_000193 [Sodalis sp.]|nr:MAG: hypothetical protein GPOALKHO_000193 [Sodalis sp.]